MVISFPVDAQPGKRFGRRCSADGAAAGPDPVLDVALPGRVTLTCGRKVNSWDRQHPGQPLHRPIRSNSSLNCVRARGGRAETDVQSGIPDIGPSRSWPWGWLGRSTELAACGWLLWRTRATPTPGTVILTSYRKQNKPASQTDASRVHAQLRTRYPAQAPLLPTA
jgi:hypothetical protein